MILSFPLVQTTCSPRNFLFPQRLAVLLLESVQKKGEDTETAKGPQDRSSKISQEKCEGMAGAGLLLVPEDYIQQQQQSLVYCLFMERQGECQCLREREINQKFPSFYTILEFPPKLVSKQITHYFQQRGLREWIISLSGVDHICYQMSNVRVYISNY